MIHQHPNSLDFSSSSSSSLLNSGHGFNITGKTGNRYSVSSAGDVNNDHIDGIQKNLIMQGQHINTFEAQIEDYHKQTIRLDMLFNL